MMNPAVEILDTQVLSDNWYVLRKVTFRLRKTDGSWETQSREAYDRGNGATILPYDPSRRTVILTRQFRLPTYVNGNLSGMLIETCAGLLDDENPQQCIVRELQEETGFDIQHPKKVMEAYMSPGSVTEILHFFVAEYAPTQRAERGRRHRRGGHRGTRDDHRGRPGENRLRRNPGRQDHHAAAIRSAAPVRKGQLTPGSLT